MIGFIWKLWRSHKVKAAERRVFLDQVHSSGHEPDDAQHMIVIQNASDHRV
jgi:hypothetical protein